LGVASIVGFCERGRKESSSFRFHMIASYPFWLKEIKNTSGLYSSGKIKPTFRNSKVNNRRIIPLKIKVNNAV